VWTAIEIEIAKASMNGTLLDVSNRTDDARIIRSDVIRDLLLGRLPNTILNGRALDPRGLRLTGATLTGRLDLDYVRLDVGLRLLGCALVDGITAEQARLAYLDLGGSTIGHSEAIEPALNGSGMTLTGNLDLVRVRASSRASGGTIRLAGAHINGRLDLGGSSLTNEGGPGLSADRLVVDNVAHLTDKFTGQSTILRVRILTSAPS
jgi:hypothetical protein